MVLLHMKGASKPSPKLMIVATGTHGSNGGPEIAMLHEVADPWRMEEDDGDGNQSAAYVGVFWAVRDAAAKVVPSPLLIICQLACG